MAKRSPSGSSRIRLRVLLLIRRRRTDYLGDWSRVWRAQRCLGLLQGRIARGLALGRECKMILRGLDGFQFFRASLSFVREVPSTCLFL